MVRFTMRLKNFLSESITKNELFRLEKILDRLYSAMKIDIEFTKHFFDRVNDIRNKREITIPELQLLFRKTYTRYAKQLQGFGDGMEAILVDLQTDINIPFVLKWNRKSKMIELVTKTIMRKKGFTSSNKKLKL